MKTSAWLLAVMLAGGLGFWLGQRNDQRSAAVNSLSAEKALPSPLQSSQKKDNPISGLTASVLKDSTLNSSLDEKIRSPSKNCGESLVETLSQLRLVEFRKACEDAEAAWMKKNLDSYARLPSHTEDVELKRWVASAVQGLAQQSFIWKGEGSLSGKASVGLTVFVEFDFLPGIDGQPPSFENLCRSMSVYYLVNGRPVGSGGAKFGTCGTFERRRGDDFYMPIFSMHDVEISPITALILIPAPYSQSRTALQFFDSTAEKWMTGGSFSWEKSSVADLESAHEEHIRRLSEK